MRTASKHRKLRNGGRKTSKGGRKTSNGGSIGSAPAAVYGRRTGFDQLQEMKDALTEIGLKQVKKKSAKINKQQKQALTERTKINAAKASGIRKTRNTFKNLIDSQNKLHEIQKDLNVEQQKLDLMLKQFKMNKMIQNAAITGEQPGNVNLAELLSALPPDKN